MLGLATAAGADAITVTSEPIGFFQRLSSSGDFGALSWRGGLTLTSESEAFGGFSGLLLGKDCEDILAVSDRGNWLQARLLYEDGKPSGIEGAVISPILDSKGQAQKSKVWADAEALTRLDNGRIAVGFESRVRFGTYDISRSGLDARFQPMQHPKEIDRGPENGEVEALGELPDGRMIAIAERQYDEKGMIRGWMWKGAKAEPFALEPYDAYRVTDLVIADGEVLTLERRFSTDSLPGMAVRRFAIADLASGRTVVPELLLEATAPLYVIDNMEAIALCERGGETRVTLMSDDNFNPSVQSTILLQFAYGR
jgi:hypothetical protein